jgi:4'-phosphopantetheinyl transferase
MVASSIVPDDIVDLRWLVLDDIAGSAWPVLHAMLDPAEQTKAAGFRFERDRRAYVAAHALVRSMLARRLGCPGTALRFAVGPYGKPELAMERAGPPLRFSLSHTHGLLAVAVTGRHAVGVDAEAIDPDRLDPDLASRIFAPAEVAQLRHLATAAATDATFAFWTLKEAFTKAIGLGLNHPFDAVAFTLDPLAVHLSPASGEDASHWLLRRWRPTPAHALALALRHPRPAAVRVAARAIGPSELVLAHGAA